MLNIQSLSNLLTEQLVRRLFVPVYLSSILNKDKFVIKDRRPIVTPLVATFLLSHVFSIITYAPLLTDLCELIFAVQDEKVFDQMCAKTSNGIVCFFILSLFFTFYLLLQNFAYLLK